MAFSHACVGPKLNYGSVICMYVPPDSATRLAVTMQRGAEGLLGRGDKGVGVDIEPVSTFADVAGTMTDGASSQLADCSHRTEHYYIGECLNRSGTGCRFLFPVHARTD